MATTKSKAEIDHSATYHVVLLRSVKVGRATVHPGPKVKLRGDILATVMADVELFEKV
tara:strand:- start:22520 stop:22693 length:174 start_codon:yes stop_codon:yes gene_type:complete